MVPRARRAGARASRAAPLAAAGAGLGLGAALAASAAWAGRGAAATPPPGPVGLARSAGGTPGVPPGRIVYLVRHGESEWNLAARRLDLWTLLSRVDHGLTPRGVAQARRLQATVGAALADGDADARAFCAPSTPVFSSPLTRAVSTTALAVGLQRTITLLPDARELAWPLCGPDSVGCAVGSRIAERTSDVLCVMDVQFCGGGLQRAALQAAVNASLAQGRWWPGGGFGGLRESRVSVRERLARLLGPQQLLGGGGEASVLVCHSHLIRQLFRDLAAPSLAESRPGLLGELRGRKLQNCGVVRAEVSADGLLTDASLVFGSEMV